MKKKFKDVKALNMTMQRDISNIKDDVLMAIGAEMSKELSELTGGEVKTTPRAARDSVQISFQGVGDDKKAAAHAQALRHVRDYIADNMEDILRKRNII